MTLDIGKINFVNNKFKSALHESLVSTNFVYKEINSTVAFETLAVRDFSGFLCFLKWSIFMPISEK